MSVSFPSKTSRPFTLSLLGLKPWKGMARLMAYLARNGVSICFLGVSSIIFPPTLATDFKILNFVCQHHFPPRLHALFTIRAKTLERNGALNG